MAASRERPGRGVFVRDQVAELARISDIEVELFEFPPGGLSYPQAARTLRTRFGATRLDIVHAHFGLTAWPALALRGPRHAVTLHGTDVRHPRSRWLTLAAVRHMDLVATVSAPLALELGGALSPPPLVLPPPLPPDAQTIGAAPSSASAATAAIIVVENLRIVLLSHGLMAVSNPFGGFCVRTP